MSWCGECSCLQIGQCHRPMRFPGLCSACSHPTAPINSLLGHDRREQRPSRPSLRDFVERGFYPSCPRQRLYYMQHVRPMWREQDGYQVNSFCGRGGGLAVTGLMASDLDEYSRLALPLILARFPAWEQFAKLSPRPDGAGNVVDFDVPCPSPAAESGLWVSTADAELSVGFHTHHNHFTDYENRFNKRQIEAGLQHAADIVEERVGVVSWYCSGGFVGSCSVELPHEGPLPRLLDGLGIRGELAGIFPDCGQATLRSWLGRFDRDEVRAEPIED